MISHARIDDDNLRMVVRQQKFRRAADVVTVSWSQFAEVVAIALIGSVARPLWKEVPRFWPYQQRRIELWHECKDVDLAIWLDDLSRLGEIRRARSLAIKTETARDPNFGVADYHVDCAFRCVKEFALGFGPPAESQAITPGANCHGITACQCCRSEVSPLRFANYHASAAIRT